MLSDLRLSDAVLRAEFTNLFGEYEERTIASDVAGYLKADIDSASVALLYVWDEMVHRGLVPNPRDMARYYPDHRNRIYAFIRETLGKESFKDAWSAEFYNRHSRQSYFGRDTIFPFAQFEIVHCYPNDIHIADVALLDLTRPVRDMTHAAPRSHAGLHLFPKFLAGLRKVALSKNATRISLVAASPSAATVFSRYDFIASEAPASAYASQFVGHGHAMILLVSRLEEANLC